MKNIDLKGKFILIGGVPCIGKSITAEKLSRKLRTNQISTDTIRALMRTVSDEEKYHSLHFFMHEEAEKYLPNTSIGKIINDYVRESRAVWIGIKKIMEKEEYNNIHIIEGVANLPILCHESGLKNILPVILYTSDPRIIRKNLFRRGLWGDSERLKEYEYEYLLKFNEYYLETAKKYGYPSVDVRPYGTLQGRILKMLGIG